MKHKRQVDVRIRRKRQVGGSIEHRWQVGVRFWRKRQVEHRIEHERQVAAAGVVPAAVSSAGCGSCLLYTSDAADE